MQTILGMQNVTFNFAAGTTSTVTVTQQLNPPAHSEIAIIVLSGFDVYYTGNEQYGFGALQVSVNVLSTQSAQATVTLRDNNTNKRQWQGSVNAVVMFLRAVD
jgi:hypothetical protein